MFARLGQIARLEIPKLPPGASIPEANFSDALRVVERACLSFAAFGFFGLAVLAGTTRMLQNGLSIATVTATAVAAEGKLGPAVLAPHGAEYQYPYSVIPGGVRSVGDFRQAISTDSQVAAHYADFDFTRARIFTLDRDSAYYVVPFGIRCFLDYRADFRTSRRNPHDGWREPRASSFGQPGCPRSRDFPSQAWSQQRQS